MKKFVGYENGINLGGWFSQCDPSKEHYDNFITEKDFANISKIGFDHVRLPIDYNLLEDENGKPISEGYVYLENTIALCKKYNLNLVLDLHKTAGFSFDSEENENGFFENNFLQERFYKLWEQIAQRFSKYHEFVAFELLNEVTDKAFSDSWNKISKNCIKRIRAISTDVRIIVGGYWNNSIAALKDLIEPYDDKIVYTFHCYEPLIFTHQGAYWIYGMPADFRLKYPDTIKHYLELQKKLHLDFNELLSTSGVETVGEEFFDELFAEAVSLAEKRNVPLYCGEYGVINLADNDSRTAWYRAINSSMKKYGISGAIWCYKEMDFGLMDYNARLNSSIESFMSEISV